MIRFIMESHVVDLHSGFESKDFVTFEAEVPELERLMTYGGKGESGFKICRLIGAEVVREEQK